MNRELLDMVKFTSEPVQLPDHLPKADTSVKGSIIAVNLSKLLFFFAIMGAIVLGGKLTFEYTWAFCRGEARQDIGITFDEIWGEK